MKLLEKREIQNLSMFSEILMVKTKFNFFNEMAGYQGFIERTMNNKLIF